MAEPTTTLMNSHGVVLQPQGSVARRYWLIYIRDLRPAKMGSDVILRGKPVTDKRAEDYQR
jgi:hypothetical protein